MEELDRSTKKPHGDDAPKRSAGSSPLNRRLFLGGLGAAAATAAVAGAGGTTAWARESGTALLPPDMLASGAQALITFSRIDGTPVYYWRSDRGNTTLRNWQCTQAFYDSLVLWIRDLRSLSSAAGYGSISYLVSAGFYVNKTGQHGAGTAMDLDHVRWSSGTLCSPLDQHHSHANQALRRRYLAVDATCRRRFRFVLDGWYNAAHADHIHSDFAALPTVCSKGATSDTKFVQAMCNNFMGSGLAVDGVWGPLTQGAFTQAKSRLGIGGDPHTSSAAWQGMLSQIASRGFTNTAI